MPAARSIIERVRDTAHPETIALESGVTVNASSGMVIASTSVNANIRVSLTGKADEPE